MRPDGNPVDRRFFEQPQKEASLSAADHPDRDRVDDKIFRVLGQPAREQCTQASSFE